MIPVFIIARDRLTYLRQSVASLSTQLDAQIYVVDHGTTNPEMIDWLRHDCPFSVIWRGNRRVHDFWTDPCNLRDDVRYAVTDSDIDFTGTPDDLISSCNLALDAFPHVVKAGPALRLDDLPPTKLGQRAREWEQQFWSKLLTTNVYEAPIDTTFAVYRPLRELREFALGPAARIAGVYAVRHMPWYETGPISDELRYYRDHMREGASHWPPED